MAERQPRLRRSWQAVWRLSWGERWLLVQAFVLLPLLGLALGLFGFRRLYGALARLAPVPHPAPADGAAALSQARAAARVVQSAAWHIPLGSTCLTRSLALWWLLRRQGIQSDVRIGVAKEAGRFQAHAWVEQGSSVLNDADNVRQRFAAFDHDPIPAEAWRHSGAWTAGS